MLSSYCEVCKLTHMCAQFTQAHTQRYTQHTPTCMCSPYILGGTHTCVHYTHTCASTCPHSHTCKPANIHTYVSTCTRTYVLTRVHTDVHKGLVYSQDQSHQDKGVPPPGLQGASLLPLLVPA